MSRCLGGAVDEPLADQATRRAVRRPARARPPHGRRRSRAARGAQQRTPVSRAHRRSRAGPDTPPRADAADPAPPGALSSAPQPPAPPAGPAPEFRTALRQRLVAVATVQGAGETQTVSSRVREAAGAWRVQRRLALV